MNLKPNYLLRVCLIIALILGGAFDTYAQSKGTKSITDYTSIAQISGTDKGQNVTYKNPYTNSNQTTFAGSFNGTLNGSPEKFYCIDLEHYLEYNKDYWDEGSTPPKMTYILNNYFPYKTSYAGKLSDDNKEAASVQLAIWHFSDGVDANTITDATIKTRTLAIIADAEANYSAYEYLETILIIPPSQAFIQGTTASFDVYTTDVNGDPLPNIQVTLTTTLGTLSATTVTTDANGHAGPLTLTYNGLGTATITAKADVTIPQGTRYVHKTNPNGKQKLVLATPTFDTKEVKGTVTWYEQPQTCDTKGYTTFTPGGWGSPSNSAPGKIRDMYFATVFPSGLTVGGTYTLKLTNAQAVEDFLPSGGTPTALTQNYINPAGTLNNTLAGHVVSLKLAVEFDKAGYLGSNPTDLEDLFIASGPFAGYSVQQFLAFAESVLGGGSLNGFTYSEVTTAATAINENFDNGTVDNGFLTCETIPCENKIGDFVWHDKDVDGIQDAGEPGIQGVVVELLNSSGNLITTTTTDSNGKYEFANLSNGTYKVRVASSNYSSGGVLFSTTQTKWYSTLKNQGSDDAKDSDAGKNESVTVTLNCNDNPTIDFGFYKTCISITKTANKQTAKPGDVITYTFVVENCGDIQHHGGVDVYDAMLGMNPYHINVLDPHATTTFTKTYTVKQTDCGELVNTVKAVGHPVDGSANVEFTAIATVFIDCTQPCLNKIGDFVWHDKDVDGIQDAGEPGIQGVVVELLDSNGNLITTTTTDASGKYLFSNLANGTYKVRIAASNYTGSGALAGSSSLKWFATFKDKGTDDSKDSDANKGESVTTTLNCNDDLKIDFGFFKVCVSLIKTGPTTVNVGEIITYTFTVENCGDVPLSSGAVVYDPMLNPNGDHAIKYLDLAPGQSATFTYEYQTTPNDCGQLTNNAWVIGHPYLLYYNFGGATVQHNDSHTVNVNCQTKEADLEVKKTASKSPVQCGETFFFTITVKNNGPDKSEGIVISDILPAGAIYQSNIPSQGTYDPNTGLWTVGDLNSGASATLKIYVKADCDQVNNSIFDLGPAKDYNLFVIKDVDQPSSDTQGKVAVGRDAKFSNYSIGDQLPPNSGDVLIVGRHLTYTSGRVYNGNVVYGNTTNLPTPGVTVDGTISQGNPINFTAAEAYLNNLSTTLSGYTVNGTTTFQWGGLTLTGNDPFLNVFKVNGADLSSANNMSITVPNGSVVLVNVDGATVNWMGGLTVNGTAIGNVLYNFYQATSMTIQGIDIRGSVLAPKANINFVAGVINGQMICKFLYGMGQMNWVPFNGNIPCEKEVTNIASVHSVTTNDPNPNNNSGSVTVIFTSGGNGGGNNGNGWQEVNGFGAGEIVYSLIYSGNTMYAGTWGGKIYKSTNNGQTWIHINGSMNVSFIWSLKAYGGFIFAATEQGVFKYNGTTWTLTSLAGMDVHALTSTASALYAGTWGFGVYKSVDAGATWTPVNNGLSYFLTIQSLTVKGTAIFCGTVGGGVFKSTNGGTSWTQFNVGNNVIWALGATSGAVFASSYGDGLYRSLDNGTTWTKLSLNVQFVYSMATTGSKIYVASWTNGVFSSTDSGNTWTSLGMGGLGVSTLVVAPNSEDIFVGTKEGQVFFSRGGGVTDVGDDENVPVKYELSQNYPNPFNPSTTIQFVVPDAGRYMLKIYNMLGQEVATLVDNDLSSGLHKVNFDANNLSSGIYVYKLIGSNVNLSKKMILMK